MPKAKTKKRIARKGKVALWLLRRFVVEVTVSGPLMALAGLAIVFLLIPVHAFAPTPAFTQLFSITGTKTWGLLCLFFSVMGYWAIYRRSETLWRRAHGFALMMFLSLALIFGRYGSYTGLATYSALALNSGLRWSGKYYEPRWRSN